MKFSVKKKTLQLVSIVSAVSVAVSGLAVFNSNSILKAAAADTSAKIVDYVQNQIPLPEDALNWRVFSPKGASKTNKGLRGSGCYTLASDPTYMPSTTLSYQGVNYKLHNNVRNTEVDADGYLSKMDSFVAAGQSIKIDANVSAVNFLVATTKNGILELADPFVINYSEGAPENSEGKHNIGDSSSQTWGYYENIAYVSPHMYGPTENAGDVNGYPRNGSLTLISIPVDSNRKTANITLPSNSELVIVAITTTLNTTSYPEGIKGYEYKAIDMDQINNYRFFGYTEAEKEQFPFVYAPEAGGENRAPELDKLYPVTGWDANGTVSSTSNTAMSNGSFKSRPIFWPDVQSTGGIPFKYDLDTTGPNVFRNNNSGEYKTLNFNADASEMKSIHLMVMGRPNGQNQQMIGQFVKLGYEGNTDSYHNIYGADWWGTAAYHTTLNYPNKNIVSRNCINGAYQSVYDMVIVPEAGKKVTSISFPSDSGDWGIVVLGMTVQKVISDKDPGGEEPEQPSEGTVAGTVTTDKAEKTEQIAVDFAREMNYKVFSPHEDVVTKEGYGDWHETYPAEELKSLDLSFSRVKFSLSENVYEAYASGKKDSLLMYGQELVFEGKERTNANSVNLLLGLGTQTKENVTFTVKYTDGTVKTHTVSTLNHFNDVNDSNYIAFISNHSHYYHHNGTSWDAKNDEPQQKVLRAVSIPTDPKKQLDSITLPATYSREQEAIFNDTAVLAMTIVAPINQYPASMKNEEGKQLRDYVSYPLDLSDIMNRNAIATSNDSNDGNFGGHGGFNQDYLYTVKQGEKGFAVLDQKVDTSFLFRGTRYELAPIGNTNENGANMRALFGSYTVTLDQGAQDKYNKLHLLVAASDGTAIGAEHGWITAKYAEGDDTIGNMYVRDWWVGKVADEVTAVNDRRNAPNVALVSKIANSQGATNAGDTVLIYDITIELDPNRVLTDIVLPQNDLYVMAMTLDKPVYGEAYGPDDEKNNTPADNRPDTSAKYYSVDIPYNTSAFAASQDRVNSGFDGNGTVYPSNEGLTQTMMFQNVPYLFGPFEEPDDQNAYVSFFPNTVIPVNPGNYTSISIAYDVFGGDRAAVPFDLIYDDGTVERCDLGYTNDWSNVHAPQAMLYTPGYFYGPDATYSIYFEKQERPLCAIVAKTVFNNPENHDKKLVGVRFPQDTSVVVFSMTLYGVQDPIPDTTLPDPDQNIPGGTDIDFGNGNNGGSNGGNSGIPELGVTGNIIFAAVLLLIACSVVVYSKKSHLQVVHKFTRKR